MKQAEIFLYRNQQVTSCPNLQCLVGSIQIQKPALAVATNYMPNHTYS